MMNATHEQINEALARAMGWVQRPGCKFWYRPGRSFDQKDPPDYFAPAGSSELEDWLYRNGWRCEPDRMGAYEGVRLCHHDKGEFSAHEPFDINSVSSSRRTCVARAAFAALDRLWIATRTTESGDPSAG